MSQASAVHQPRIHVRSGALKIIVFGMPGAGKTSLLGAMAQAAQSQEKVLGGNLTDRGGDFGDLRRHVYEGKPPHPVNDLTVYPLVFQPHDTLGSGKRSRTGPVDIALFDCDGRGATEFLARRDALVNHQYRRLADALLQSDTLLLTVDASSRPEILRRDVGLFLSFLRLFQDGRSNRNEVNGLPVHVVLTKCDLIADSNDTPSSWIDKIEDRKRKIDQYFRTQLEKEGQTASPQFGAIDLHVWATAVRRPALANVAARPQEPYQVAELFRECLNSAVEFHHQRDKAERKLNRTFLGTLAVACLLALLVGLFLVTREQPAAVQLENRIKSFLSIYNKNSPERFRQIGDAIPRLEGFQKDPAFSIVEPDLRKWVNEEVAELHAYSEFADNVKKTIEPAFIATDDKLKEQKEKLNALVPPKDYAVTWEQTPAVKMRKERLEEVQAISLALTDVVGKLDKVINSAKALKEEIGEYTKLPTSEKPQAAAKILPKQQELRQLAAQLPDRKTHASYPLRPGSRVTWGNLFSFPEVGQRYSQWEALEPKVLKEII
jgi:GTPase SAR1 family protein